MRILLSIIQTLPDNYYIFGYYISGCDHLTENVITEIVIIKNVIHEIRRVYVLIFIPGIEFFQIATDSTDGWTHTLCNIWEWLNLFVFYSNITIIHAFYKNSRIAKPII